MPRYNSPFEIHVHGEVPLRADVGFDQLQEALKPLWTYAGAKSLVEGAASAYEEEPGIRLDTKTHLLHLCWTVSGDEDFRQALDEMCMGLNELAESGAPIEVTFYDADFDEDEEGGSGQRSDSDDDAAKGDPEKNYYECLVGADGKPVYTKSQFNRRVGADAESAPLTFMQQVSMPAFNVTVQWECPRCTFVNEDDHKCGMCDAPKA